MKKISIITPVYNEEQNIETIITATQNVLESLTHLDYEHIFIDNNSKDRTKDILRDFAKENKKIKVIFNTKNFGYIRSSYYGVLQGTGDAIILMSADMQDPPELIREFIKQWESGKNIILGQKINSTENFIIKSVRKIYYRIIQKISENELTKDTLGYGLYAKSIIDATRTINDPYPYFRGIVTEVDDNIHLIPYIQPKRKFGKTKFSFLSMYDIAITGIVKHSKVPIRFMSIVGFLSSMLSILIAFGYLVYKLLSWDSFIGGVAPTLIGIYTLASFQLFFMGLMGEYILSIHTNTRKIPLVFEKERLNF
jgi:glycosyltransferase involved in cell wall biosynthesis